MNSIAPIKYPVELFVSTEIIVDEIVVIDIYNQYYSMQS